MPLRSQLFADDAKLEACLTNNAAHLVPGAQGEHVGKVQTALFLVDGLSVDPAELNAELYGKSTAAAVLAYKKKRKIINQSYQTHGGRHRRQDDDRFARRGCSLAEERQLADFPLEPQRRSFV